MAKRITELVADISGESGASTTRFHLDGIDYETDIVDVKDLREGFAPWISKARRVNGRRTSMASERINGRHRHDMHRIRLWARANNIAVPVRGVMPWAVIEAYNRDRWGQ